MAETSIQWADFTFNPWSGCSKVSPGCQNCYAEVNYSVRMRGVKWGPQGNRIVAAESMWKQPLKWNKAAKCTCNAAIGKSHMEAFETCLQHRASGRPRVFCASLADVFEDWSGDMLNSKGEPLIANQWLPELGRGSGDRLTMSHVRERLGNLIKDTPNLNWLILSKRANNIAPMMEDHMFGVHMRGSYDPLNGKIAIPDNLWIGVSVENQKYADERIPILLKTPAAIRFISYEPALGPVNFEPFLQYQPLTDNYKMTMGMQPWRGLDWIIVGGESGQNARQFNVEWARNTIEQCKDSDCKVLVKQLGSNPHDTTRRLGLAPGVASNKFNIRWRLKDPKGGDMDEWPADIRVRQFPEAKQ